VRCRLSE